MEQSVVLLCLLLLESRAFEAVLQPWAWPAFSTRFCGGRGTMESTLMASSSVRGPKGHSMPQELGWQKSEDHTSLLQVPVRLFYSHLLSTIQLLPALTSGAWLFYTGNTSAPPTPPLGPEALFLRSCILFWCSGEGASMEGWSCQLHPLDSWLTQRYPAQVFVQLRWQGQAVLQLSHFESCALG